VHEQLLQENANLANAPDSSAAAAAGAAAVNAAAEADTTMQDGAPVLPAAAESNPCSSSSSSSQAAPCTALKGKDAVVLAGVVAHGGRGMYNKTSHSGYGAYAGSDCCGSCWKSSHIKSRARWGGRAAAAAGQHRS
jgi:hypothetical protein